MATRILCVDDDLNVLAAHERNLRRHFEIKTAPSAEAGLATLKSEGPFAVILSDMQMPGMDGSAFLNLASSLAPEAVRVMLTGNNDQETAIRAVNEGSVFRFVTKPCDAPTLIQTLQAALKQHHLIIAEKELLEQTLNGSVKLLTDVLALANPSAYSKATLLRDYVREYLTINETLTTAKWEIEMAAMVLDLGQVTIPQVVIEKGGCGAELSVAEKDVLQQIPEMGFNLLSNIPRLENVAKIVLYQDKCYDGTGFPKDALKEQEIPFGARLIKVLKDLIEREAGGLSRAEAASVLRARKGTYDLPILDYCASHLKSQPSVTQQAGQVSSVLIKQLTNKHILVSPLLTREGMLIAPGGTEVTNLLLQKIRNFKSFHVLREPLQVRMGCS
jgi:response regulator RpfG family c-di-GMP phosphodiesterase